MSFFDEQPDVPLHGECAQEIERLTNLLRDEWSLRLRIATSPWRCISYSCPYFGEPMVKNCKCFTEAHAVHAAKVLEVFK